MPSAILVVGPGAVGGVLACRWALAGREVRLLGRGRRLERVLERRGMTLVGTSGARRRLRRGLLATRGRPGPGDAVFLCVKSYDFAAALRAARPWVGPETAVVALQNGVGHERLLRRAFGPRRAVAGVCYVAAERLGPGVVAHNGGRDLVLARRGPNGPAVAKAAGLLRAGGWRVRVSGSEERVLWTKLCFNAAGNALGALCLATTGEMALDPALRQILRSSMREAVLVARAEGRPPLHRDMEGRLLRGCRASPAQRNSMLQDLAAGRRTEVDAIYGPLLASARRRRIPVPVLTRLSRLVRRLEADL